MLRVTGGGENRSVNCHCFCSESFFLASLILLEEAVATDMVSICVVMHESICSTPDDLNTQNRKISPDEVFWEKKPLLD